MQLFIPLSNTKVSALLSRIGFGMLFFYCLATQGYSQSTPPLKQWDKTFGGTDDDMLSTMIRTSDGGYLLGGRSNSGIGGDKSEPNNRSRGGNTYDFWVVKIDKDGKKQWDKTFGSSAPDELTAMVQTVDGGYLLGGNFPPGAVGGKLFSPEEFYSSVFWLVKIDKDGNEQWDKTFENSMLDHLTSIVVASDGGYLLGGSSGNLIPSDYWYWLFDSHYWVVKVDKDGNKQWDKTYAGGGDFDELTSIIASPEGGYLLGGSSSSGIGKDKSEASRGYFDYWIVKIDKDGKKQWDKTLGGSDYDGLTAMTAAPDSNYLLTGYSNSPVSGDKSQASSGYDYWIVKIDKEGKKIWDNNFNTGAPSSTTRSSIVPAYNGGYLLGRSSIPALGSPGLPGSEAQAIKINEDGSKLWERTFHTDGIKYGNPSKIVAYDYISSVAVASDSGYVLAGYSWSGAGGDKTEPKRGADATYDYWVIKLAPDLVKENQSIMLSPVAASADESAAAGYSKKLRVTISSNPSSHYFTLNIVSADKQQPVSLQVTDLAGRVIESMNGLAADQPIRIGSNLRTGMYIASVIQGMQRVTFKLMKQ